MVNQRRLRATLAVLPVLAILAGVMLRTSNAPPNTPARASLEPAKTSSAQGPSQELDAGAYWLGSISMESEDPNVHVEVSVDPHGAKVYVDWKWIPPQAPRTAASASQTFNTLYQPTYACGIGPRQIAVAGKEIGGDTLIEFWTFGQALKTEALTPPPQGGHRFALQAGLRTEKTEIYRQSGLGLDTIAQMTRMLGPEDSTLLLLRFWDSKDVYRLDWTTELLTRLASPQSGAFGALHVPELAFEDSSALRRGNHSLLGDVYIFPRRSGSDGVRDPFVSTLVLIDSDRDGVLDDRLWLDGAGWVTHGLDDPANFVD